MTEEELETTVEETPEAVTEPVTVETISTEEEGVTVNVTIEQSAATASVDEDDQETVLEDDEIGTDDPVSIRTFSVTSLDVLEDAQSGDVPQVMADVIENVLGEYHRITYTVEEMDSEGNVIATSTEYVPGLAGLDYAWITGAILFGLFIAGCFKLLGGLIRS